MSSLMGASMRSMTRSSDSLLSSDRLRSVPMRICLMIFLAGVVTCGTARSVFAQGDESAVGKVQIDPPSPRIQIFVPVASRPAVLPSLYVALGALQAFDG